MTLVGDLQTKADSLIDLLGSTIIFTPTTESNTYGGYSGSSSNGTAITTVGVSSSLVSRRFGLQDFGNTEEGNTRVVIKSSVSLTSGTKYNVSWNSQSWELKDIQDRGFGQNTTTFKVVTLSKVI